MELHSYKVEKLNASIRPSLQILARFVTMCALSIHTSQYAYVYVCAVYMHGCALDDQSHQTVQTHNYMIELGSGDAQYNFMNHVWFESDCIGD